MRDIFSKEDQSRPRHWMSQTGNYLISPARDSDIGIKFDKTIRAVRKNVNIALINNMQGASNVATELYFRDLLSASSDGLVLRLGVFSPLSSSAKRSPELDKLILEQIYNFEPDALIVTGMEPATPDLRSEPLWPFMSNLFGWAESHGIPAILSCLAAHAAVLYSDNVARVPLKEKRFGVFEHRLASEHMLTRGLPKFFRVPHSRWNELDPADLIEKGYQLLTCSDAAGVDIFVKQRRSLFVHFQGHMEYKAETLFSEYKRDIRRFLAGKRAVYPSKPQSYFSSEHETTLDAFRERALKERDPQLWSSFPGGIGPAEPIAPWDEAGRIVFRNFLNYVVNANA